MSSAHVSAYQRRIGDYWNEEARPVNLRLGDVDGLYHHHYGIGDVDWSVLEQPDDTRDQAVVNELHRLESDQVELLLSHLGTLTPADTVIDAGCGRGGSLVMAHRAFGCRAEGVTLSEKQADFANGKAAEYGIADHVRAHVADMLSMPFATGGAAASWNNESSMYVDVDDLMAEQARVLRRGGRYVVITGCWNDVHGRPSKTVSQINWHFECTIHSRRQYFQALARNRFAPVKVSDLSEATIPYWELRSRSSVTTGIEEAVLSSLKDGSSQYLLIVADRV